jgi:hypothetical protein
MLNLDISGLKSSTMRISDVQQQKCRQELARKLPRRFADGFWKNEA